MEDVKINRRGCTSTALMERVFPGARENLEGAHLFHGRSNPTNCAYAVYQKCAYAAYGPYVATAEGRIHFCGEHASPWPGCIQGALYSGIGCLVNKSVTHRPSRVVKAGLLPT